MRPVHRMTSWSVTAFLILACLPGFTHAGLPRLTRIVPPGGQRGTTIEVQLQGKYFEKPEEVLLYEPGITVEALELVEGNVEIRGRRNRVEAGSAVRVKLKIADNCELGLHGLRLRTATGISDYQRFFVSPFPMIDEAEQQRESRNDSQETAQALSPNTTLLGRMHEPADVDYYRVDVKQGQRISAEIEGIRLGVESGIPDLHLTLLDSDGKRLIAADDSALFVQDPVVSVIAPKEGSYFVEVRHSTYSANGDVYRLHLGTFSRPAGVYPAGGPAGKELSLQILGDPKGAWNQVAKLPALNSGDSTSSSSSPVPASRDFRFVAIDPETQIPTPTPNTVRVSPFENVLEAEPNESIEAASSQTAATLPMAFNGIIQKAGDIDCFKFVAHKGDRFRFHCLANALGSPLDPTLWIKQIGAKGNPQRATDSRPNQLGYPPYGGVNRDTLDAFLEFTAPADGEYVLGVEDDRGNGGADFVYRVEVAPETDAVFVYIPQDGEAAFQPQARQSVSVPSGGRYNAQLSIVNTNRPFNGDLELIALGLPEGVVMHAPRITPAMPRVPVVFEAAPDAKLQGGLIEIVARPAVNDPNPNEPQSDASKPSSSESKPAEPERKLVSGFRQSIAMSAFNNNDYYLFNTFDKLAIAVTEPAPFSIEIEEPKSALVQNGEISLKFKIVRRDGFDEPVSVAMEWKPNGVSTGTPVTIGREKSEGEYLLGASRGATAGAYQVTLSAVSGGQRPAYRDASSRTYVSTKLFKLLVAEPHIDAKFARASIERGKTANLTVKLNHLKPFEGKAKATLARLPRGIELVEPFQEISPADKEVTFTLKATEDCLTGGYQGITLDVTVNEEGQAVKQLSGSGTLRIDAERGVKAAMK